MKRFESLYDLAPMRSRLEKLVDFGRLNDGSLRVSVATTDIETGGLWSSTRARGRTSEWSTCSRAAACCYANAPVEIVLDKWTQGPIFVLDLFAREGNRPTTLEAALERKSDLIFGNQTFRFLNSHCKAERAGAPPILYFSYHASKHEAGPEKTFDLSRATISDRWKSGMLDVEHALERMGSGEELPHFVAIRRPH